MLPAEARVAACILTSYRKCSCREAGIPGLLTLIAVLDIHTSNLAVVWLWSFTVTSACITFPTAKGFCVHGAPLNLNALSQVNPGRCTFHIFLFGFDGTNQPNAQGPIWPEALRTHHDGWTAHPRHRWRGNRPVYRSHQTTYRQLAVNVAVKRLPYGDLLS